MRRKRISRQRKYPWDRWFKRRRLTLRRGTDYECQSHSMAQQFRNEASRRGARVSIEVEDGTVRVLEIDNQ